MDPVSEHVQGWIHQGLALQANQAYDEAQGFIDQIMLNLMHHDDMMLELDSLLFLKLCHQQARYYLTSYVDALQQNHRQIANTLKLSAEKIYSLLQKHYISHLSSKDQIAFYQSVADNYASLLPFEESELLSNYLMALRHIEMNHFNTEEMHHSMDQLFFRIIFHEIIKIERNAKNDLVSMYQYYSKLIHAASIYLSHTEINQHIETLFEQAIHDYCDACKARLAQLTPKNKTILPGLISEIEHMLPLFHRYRFKKIIELKQAIVEKILWQSQFDTSYEQSIHHHMTEVLNQLVMPLRLTQESFTNITSFYQSRITSFQQIKEQCTAVDSIPTYQSKMIEWLKYQCKIIESFLGNAPCGYSWIAFSSLARGDFSLNSDLELGLLIQDKNYRTHPYFQAYFRLLNFVINTLGENPKLSTFHHFTDGFCIDSGERGFFLAPNCDKIQDVDGFIDWITENLRNHLFNVATATFQQIEFYSNREGAQLCSELTMRLNQKWSREIEFRHSCIQKLLDDHGAFYESVKKDQEVGFKKRYLHPLLFYVQCLRLYWIDKTDSWSNNLVEHLKQLTQQGVVNVVFLKQLINTLMLCQKVRLYEARNELEKISDTEIDQVKQMVDSIYHSLQCWLDTKDFSLLSILFKNPLVFVYDVSLTSQNIPTHWHDGVVLEYIPIYHNQNISEKEVFEQYRTYYRLLTTEQRYRFLTKLETLEDPLRMAKLWQWLGKIANLDGTRCFTEHNKLIWKTQYLALLRAQQASTNEARSLDTPHFFLTLPGEPEFELSMNVIEQLWDGERFKHWIPQKARSNHVVSRLQLHDDEFGNLCYFIKFDPEMPHNEIMTSELYLNLIGFGTSFSTCGKLRVVRNKSIQCYIVLISQSIPGAITLDQLLTSNRINSLDSYNYSWHVLITFLLNAGDVSFKNLVLTRYLNEDMEWGLGLDCIDHDRMMMQNPYGLNNQVLLNNCLLALDKANQLLHPKAVEEFLAINPLQLIDVLYQHCQQADTLFRELFNEQEMIQLLSQQKQNKVFLSVPTQTFEQLYQRLEYMQQKLQQWNTSNDETSNYERLPDNMIQGTPLWLFFKLYPRLGTEYWNAFLKETKPMDRFMAVCKDSYEHVANNETIVSAMHTAQLGASKICGPSLRSSLFGQNQALKTQFAVAVQAPRIQLLHRLNVLCRQVEEQITQQSTLQNAIMLFQSLPSSAKENIIHRLDFRTIPDALSKQLLEVGLTSIKLRKLRLQHCHRLTDRQLLKIIEQHPELEVLDIIDAPLLKNIQLSKIEKKLQHHNLQIIILDHCSSLESITLTEGLIHTLVVKSCALKSININKVAEKKNIILEKFEHELRHLDVSECTYLTQLNIQECWSQLRVLNIAHTGIKSLPAVDTPRLISLNLSGCAHLIECGIRLYNLKIIQIKGLNSQCEFKGCSIPTWILVSLYTNDSSMVLLDLRAYNVNDATLSFLARILMTNTELIELQLPSSDISARAALQFVNTLSHQTTLKRIEFGNELLNAIVKFARNDPTLMQLYLSNKEIGDAGAKDIANALEHNTTLAQLDLSSNDIGAAGAKAIANALEHNTTLATLSLWDNHIGDAGAKAIANALEHNTTLAQLDLGYNDIGAAGAEAESLIKQYLERNQQLSANTLQVTHLSSNPSTLFTATDQQSSTMLEQEHDDAPKPS